MISSRLGRRAIKAGRTSFRASQIAYILQNNDWAGGYEPVL